MGLAPPAALKAPVPLPQPSHSQGDHVVSKLVHSQGGKTVLKLITTKSLVKVYVSISRLMLSHLVTFKAALIRDYLQN